MPRSRVGDWAVEPVGKNRHGSRAATRSRHLRMYADVRMPGVAAVLTVHFFQQKAWGQMPVATVPIEAPSLS